MPFVTSTTGSLGAGRRNVPEETTVDINPTMWPKHWH